MADADDETPGGDDDGAADEDARPEAPERATPRPRRRALDGRTLAICVLIALVAALAAGAVTAWLTSEDDPPPGEGELTLARSLPDLALPVLGEDGEQIALADYEGRPLVVNFWGSWCEPCVAEMPALERVHASLGDEVAFLGVNVNDSTEAALRMAARTGVTYDLVRDEDGALGRALEVTTFPTTILVLPDGTIVDTVRREISAERLCEKINQSLMNQALEECG